MHPVTTRGKLFHQMFERRVLMGIGLQGSLVDTRQKIDEAGVARQIVAHDQRVDQRADQVLGFDVVPIGNRHPHRKIELAAAARQHQLEAGQQAHERCRAMPVAELLERFDAGQGQFCIDGATTSAEWAAPRQIGGQ